MPLASPQPIFEATAPDWALRGAKRIDDRLSGLERLKSAGRVITYEDYGLDPNASNNKDNLKRLGDAVSALGGGCTVIAPPRQSYNITGLADQERLINIQNCSGVTWLSNGSKFTTPDDLNSTPKIVYGAIITDSDDCDIRVTFEQSRNIATRYDAGGIYAVYLLNTCQDMEIRARSIGGLAGVVCAGGATLPLGSRANNLTLMVQASYSTYGANFQGNGDGVIATVHTNNVGRGYFVWNARGHRFTLVSDNHKGDLNDLLIKAYAFTDPTVSITADIKGFYLRRNSSGDTPSDSSAMAFAFDQAVAGYQPAVLSGIEVDFFCDYAGLANPAEMALLLFSGHDGVFSSVSVAHVLENMRLSGAVRNMTSGSTPTLIDFFSSQNATGLIGRNVEFSNITATATSGAAINADGRIFGNGRLTMKNIVMDGNVNTTNFGAASLAQSNIYAANLTI